MMLNFYNTKYEIPLVVDNYVTISSFTLFKACSFNAPLSFLFALFILWSSLFNSFHSFPPGLSQSNCHGFGAWWWSSGKHYFILNSSNAIVWYRVNRHYITTKKSLVDLIGDFPYYLSYNSSDVSLENMALDQLIILS